MCFRTCNFVGFPLVIFFITRYGVIKKYFQEYGVKLITFDNTIRIYT
jgi:hypothetical protein